MHIGILNTCDDDADFAKAFPNDGERFIHLLEPLRPDWRFTVVLVKDNVFPAQVTDYDGYVITGSPASVNGDAPWIARLMDFIRALNDAKRPTIGVCFGHQAIAKALGGKVERAADWGLGISPTHFSKHERWMSPPHETLNLYAAHGEQVTALPKGAEVLGSSAACPVGALRIGEHIFTTEYHPEMTKAFIAALTDYLEPHLDARVIERSRQQIEGTAEGPLFAEWMAKFLELPRQK
jgi:GMP synthase-like glutamine amidotransferase